MNKKTSLLFGLTLVIIAFLALGAALLVDLDGVHSDRTSISSWPLLVIGAGLLFCIPPFLFRNQRGLGGLFIPGIPVLTTGILLFLASVTDNWGLWSNFWAFEVIGAALGFVLAAIFLRVVWLFLPASIIGFTGLALLFTSLTGTWAAWVVLWTVVPFATGFPLLLIGIFRKLDGVKLAGIILCGFAGLAFAALSTFLPTDILAFRLIGPVVILILGGLLIASAAIKKQVPTAVTPEKAE